MKAQHISNSRDGYRKTIWNLVKSLEVILTIGQAWQMKLVPIFQYSPCATNHFCSIWMPLQGVKIPIGTQTKSGSKMVNTTRHVKIDAKLFFYFMILPVGKTLIFLPVSVKAKLELYTDGHGTLIFDKYEECSPKNHERTRSTKVGTIGYNFKLQMLLFCWEVIMKNKNK